MDFTQLVEEITRQVCARLEGAESLSGGFQVAPPPSTRRSQSILVVWSRTEPATAGFDYDVLVDALAAVAKACPVVFTVYPSAVFPCTGLPERLPEGAVRLLPGEPRWRDEAPRHQALLLPHAGVDVLAKLSVLIADEPMVEATLQMLILNRPVLAGQDDVSTLMQATTARGVLEVLRRHQREVQSLGVQLLERTDTTGPRLMSLLAAPGSAGSTVLGRTVVTQDDIHLLGQQGQKRVVYGAGSIVTALAWEAAQRFGIEVVLQ